MTSHPAPPSPGAHPVIDTVVVTATDSPSVIFEGHGMLRGADLVGSRQSLAAEVTWRGDTWRAEVPLLDSSWRGPLLPPRSGRYVLTAAGPDPIPVSSTAELPAPQLLPGVTRVSFAAGENGLEIVFAAPLTDRERGSLQQASLEADYRATAYEPLNAVFFESFWGQNASCNPRAIDRSLARLRPDITRYWSVADASVEVPEGAVALIEGSVEWWRIRGSARLLVVNDWLRKRLRKRAYQTVLQTWHGTMLKKLALSRLRLGLRPMLATLSESSRWDILLAQNPYSRKVFRRAYAFRGPVWEEGYPRDDILVTGDAAAVRERLGIPDDVTVLLYAPTWRDDHPDQVDHLDVSRFATSMGEGYVTLIRGHSRTLRPGQDVHADNVLDVTGYPDVSELFLVADVLITDYSSVMFDFTVTGKPVFFFTPDLEHYREKLRGFYFDLIPWAPGPVVPTLEELVELIRVREAIRPGFARKYRAWQARFNPLDDGGAADRVVNRLLAEGIVG
ncbi:MAG TPA: CDP-glycerol glycerophosphotransferase family protein [Lacisediminihabitans sp.]|uniref:CDP-glycerol glycerophosphotransferase family protein n=1 Tax=Lacisediminihabitans sp. TaxID=2787631 RepID=UPI002EDA9788